MRVQNIRLPEQVHGKVTEYCKHERISFSTFCRQAIAEKFARDNAFEERLASTLAAFRAEQQALIRMLDKYVLLFLTCVSEPPSNVLAENRKAAKLRYDKWLASVASEFSNGNGNRNGHKENQISAQGDV